MSKTIDIIKIFFSLCLVVSCVKNRNFEPPENACAIELSANTTYAEVKNLYVDKTLQIQVDFIIEGYVNSSDKAGNFFSELHFQDKEVEPAEGFQIEIDVRDSHLFYPVGSKIFIKLKGLYLGKSKEVFKIGGVFTSFGNVSVGRLPSTIVDQHIFVSCDAVIDLHPKQISVSELQENLTNTLVQLNNVEILSEELKKPFAEEREETERTITDCKGNEVILLNSGFSDFYNEELPSGHGAITGVLLREKDDYQLVIRDLFDIDFSEERCKDFIVGSSSEEIFISELADPENNIGARFVEIYNSSSETLDLRGWTIRRYTNDNTDISSIINLTGFQIEGTSAFTISSKTQEFELVYGFLPNMGVSTNSPADSNGDDNLELVDPFGQVIDVFGIVGEDGSGTNHEFEDGRAIRNIDVTKGNATYTFSEWTIYNDTGESGTIEQPQIAPDDFSPGERN